MCVCVCVLYMVIKNVMGKIYDEEGKPLTYASFPGCEFVLFVCCFITIQIDG